MTIINNTSLISHHVHSDSWVIEPSNLRTYLQEIFFIFLVFKLSESLRLSLEQSLYISLTLLFLFNYRHVVKKLLKVVSGSSVLVLKIIFVI